MLRVYAMVWEIVQWLRALAALAEEMSSIHSTQIGFTTACNSRSRESGALFWPLQVSAHADTQSYTN